MWTLLDTSGNIVHQEYARLNSLADLSGPVFGVIASFDLTLLAVLVSSVAPLANITSSGDR